MKISEASRDYLRLFALIRDPKPGQIKIELYQCKNIVFGLHCAPYIAKWIVHTNVQKYLGAEYDKASRSILNKAKRL